MEPADLASGLREQMRDRPYWTTAAIIGVGWILGRSLPLRVLLTALAILFLLGLVALPVFLLAR